MIRGGVVVGWAGAGGALISSLWEHETQAELAALHARCQLLTREARRKDRLVREVMALKQQRMAPQAGGRKGRWRSGRRPRCVVVL